MKTVPHADRAVVGQSKITDYLLCETHPVGGAKAAFFTQFGFRQDRPEELARALCDHVRDSFVVDVIASIYGTKYRVDGPLTSPDKRNPMISSVWMILEGETVPRFVTAFPC